MLISSVAQVLLRLAALGWFLSGVAQLVASMVIGPAEPMFLPNYAIPAVLILFSVVTWWIAPGLARRLAWGTDAELAIDRLTLRKLYATAFVGLGLWFALASFGSLFNAIHFQLAFAENPGDFTGLYKITEPALTLAAGATLIATAHIWSKKLARLAGDEPTE
ncbi:MAG: hypothetical protein SFU53_06415 [Terrimicrobiaceae bacterium]|nr:hypothetical protein [Terrimicrobiaceae bacterium]